MSKASLPSFGQVASGPTPVWAWEGKNQEDLHERSSPITFLRVVIEGA